MRMIENVTLHIRETGEKSAVSPFIFGHFIEYMNDCIDPGMWAEVLQDRSFEGQPGEKWQVFGEASATSCRDVSYAPERSMLVRCRGEGGVVQRGLPLETETCYEGHVWAYAQQDCSITVQIRDEEGSRIILHEKKELAKGQWERCAFHFHTKGLPKKTAMQLRICGDKTVFWLDQASITPRNTFCGIWEQTASYIKALHPTVLRFPGGCASDFYHWQDGIGPRDKRPTRSNLHWGGCEPNNFGTDEYIAFCRRIGCEPLISINFAASPQEAADWVEYCNGDPTAGYGRLRAQNGHPQPYQVTYWEIGNEIFGDWEIGHCSAEEYSEKYMDFYRAMKAADSRIRCLACGGDGSYIDQSWNQTILEKLSGRIDMLAVHFYEPLAAPADADDAQIYHAMMAAGKKVDEVIDSCLRTMDRCGTRLPIAVTEWNCNYTEKDGTKREQTFESALSNAAVLHTFLRHTEDIVMCNMSDLVNGWNGGIIRSEYGKTYGTASYYMMKMYAEAGIKAVIDCACETKRFDESGFGNIPAYQAIPELDILCTENADGTHCAFIINKAMDTDYRIIFPQKQVKAIKRLWNEHVLAVNTIDNEQISIEDCAVCDEVQVAAHSLYCVRLA